MGILNVTGDSFYDGGRYLSLDNAVQRAEEMVSHGVDIIDVGAQSTRPGAEKVASVREAGQVVPVIEAVRKNHPEILISADTFYADVAEKAAGAGADIINDVYGGREDARMFEAVARLELPYVLMHSRGDASNMASMTTYDNFLKEIVDYFEKNIYRLEQAGVKDIILDPGFGFAKTLDQNYRLMAYLDILKMFGKPLLIGVSRKSLITKLLENTAEEALAGTIALNTVALQKGASVLRVHDVKEAVAVRRIIDKLQHA